MNTTEPKTIKLDDLLRICHSLFKIDPHSKVVSFVHTSFRDFLETLPEFEADKVNYIVASSCLSACMHEIPTAMTKFPEPMDSIYQYGVIYWAEHIHAISHDIDNNLYSLMESFVFDDDFTGWLDEISDIAESMPRDRPLKRTLLTFQNATGTPLFLASAFGFTKLFDTLVQDDQFDWNQTSNSGHTALYLACVAGKQQVVALLIANGANVNAAGGHYGNPLQAACFEGHLSIVQLLLQNGAEAQRNGKFTTALEAAMIARQEAIALLLLRKYHPIRSQEAYATVIRWAAQFGHIRVLDYLEETYSTTFGKASHPDAIERAIAKGSIRTLERLLKDPSAEIPPSAVSIAVSNRQKSMALYLLHNKGSNVEAEGQLGTPLRTAVIMEWDDMVNELLRAGADPNTSTYLGDALQAAATRGLVLLVRTLVQEGARPNNSGGHYGNALQAASYCGHVDVVKLLLEAGANVHSTGYAKDAIHAAVEGGQEHVVRYFLDAGFASKVPLPKLVSNSLEPRSFKDNLRAASPSRKGGDGSEDSAQFSTVVSSNLDINGKRGLPLKPYAKPRPDMRNYALAAAASRGQVSIVKIFLSREYLEEREIEGALREAISKGHVQVVTTILDSDFILSPTLLIQAIESASLWKASEILETLLEHWKVLVTNSRPMPQHTRHSRRVRASEMSLSSTRSSLTKSEWLQQLDFDRSILLKSCKLTNISILIDVLTLMEQRYSIDQMATAKEDAIYECSKSGTSEAVKALINKTTITQSVRLKAFGIACFFGRNQALLPLLHCEVGGSLSTEELREGFIASAGSGDLTSLRQLHERLPIANLTQETLDAALNIASLNGRLNSVTYLMQQSGNPNAICGERIGLVDRTKPGDLGSKFFLPRTKTTSVEAAADGIQRSLHDEADITERENIVIQLIQSGANANLALERSPDVLHILAKFCSSKVVDVIINSGVSLKDFTNPALLEMLDSIDLPLPAKKESRWRSGAHRRPSSTLSTSFSTDHEGFQCSQFGVSVLQTAAEREIGSTEMIRSLLKAGVELPINQTGPNIVLDAALEFFKGGFDQERPLQAIFNDGPGGVVKTILRLLPNESVDDPRYGLLLQMAVVLHDVDFIELLLQRGIDVNMEGHRYGTALQCATRFGYSDFARVLLKAGAKTNTIGGAYGTALQCAASLGHSDLVQFLLGSGAEVNQVGGRYGTALRAAAMAGEEPILGILIAAGADPNREAPCKRYQRPIKPLLCSVLELKHYGIAKRLISAGANVNPDEERRFSPLMEGVVQGDTSMVTLLLDSGADINAPGIVSPSHSYQLDNQVGALHVACSKDDENMVQLLIERGADVNLEIKSDHDRDSSKHLTSPTPLQAAASNGSPSIIRHLIQAGAEVNRENCHGTALYCAAAGNKLDSVEQLLASGASIGSESLPFNPVVAACRIKSHEVTQLFLECMSGTPFLESSFTEALTFATSNRDDRTYRLLLDYGAPKVPATLSQACSASLDASVKSLLSYGVDVNCVLADGGRPIHIAAFAQQYTMVDFLLSQGADADIETKSMELLFRPWPRDI